MDRNGAKRRAFICGLGMAGAWIALMAICRRSAEGTDWLTGAGDQDAFRQRLKRNRRAGALVLARLRNLGAVNRTLGYRAGDEALSRAAEVLRGCWGRSGDLYRIGGRTFVLVLPRQEASALEHIAGRSERLYGTGAAGDTLVVTWAVGPDTLQALLGQAKAEMSRVL